MNHWWVNHKQTHKVEISEGYIWSPMTNNNGGRNETYLNLHRTAVGDIIFSYADGRISAVGVVDKQCSVAPRPVEFGKVGVQWSNDGWLVSTQWITINNPLLPKSHLKEIAPLLPGRNSPIRTDGNGNQGCYLASIDEKLSNKLIELISEQNVDFYLLLEDLRTSVREENETVKIENKPIPPTSKKQLIEARVGQGSYRKSVERIESRCRLTDLRQKQFLIASHIKPWVDSTDEEKLDGNNGLLLSPHADKLFDKGYISFSDKGEILFAHNKIRIVFKEWNLDPNKNVGNFTNAQKKYLKYHREVTFADKKQILSL